ncbi:MAG: LacI family DNA-binding transcriptional regulator [Verrucomicrobiota bacterium]
MSSKHIRLADIAEEAGVTIAAVSMALRNSPQISAATREKIQALAKKMNYLPDAAARALASKGAENRRGAMGAIGLLASEYIIQSESGKRSLQHSTRVWRNACERTGYSLDEFIVSKRKADQRRLNDILQNRGITGLLVTCPHESVRDWALDWDHFAAVARTSASDDPFLHSVASTSFHDAFTATKAVIDAGYKRPGIYFPDPVFSVWVGGYEAAVIRSLPDCIIPPLTLSSLSREERLPRLKEWIKQEQPDVIISNHGRRMLEELQELGMKVPEDIGYCALDVGANSALLSGLSQRRDVAYQTMVDLLNGMLMRNETGPPEVPMVVQVASTWNKGKTLHYRRKRKG